MHAYNTLKEARDLVFTTASRRKAKKAIFNIENNFLLSKFIYKLTSF
jgi:hypothetical protein